MSKVLTHATIYTGEAERPVIKDAYIRFDNQIEAIGNNGVYRHQRENTRGC